MSRFKLIPYFVRIHDESNELIDNKVAQKIITSFLDNYKNKTKNFKDEQKTLYVAKTSILHNSSGLFGIIRAGDYGIETDFYDIEKQIHRKKARKVNNSEEYPFSFLIYYPKKLPPIIIFMMFKSLGIKSLFTELLFEEMVNETISSIRINPIVSKEKLDETLKGKTIKELHLIKLKVPKAYGDRIAVQNYEDIRYAEKIYAKVNKEIQFKNLIEDVLANIKNLEYPFAELEDNNNKKYDDAKLVTKDGTLTKTFSLFKKNLKEVYILDGALANLGNDGFPKQEYLKKASIECLNHILKLFKEDTYVDSK